MPRKSMREPALIAHVLHAIAKLKDDRRATTSRIVNYIHTSLKNSGKKFKLHKLAHHVKEALQYGVEVNLFKVKPGRYLLGSQSNFDMDFKESMKKPPDAQKNKQPSASATPTTMSSISAGGLSTNAHNASMDEHLSRQNKTRCRSRSRKHKDKRKKRRRPPKDHSVSSGGNTPKPEPPAKKPAVYRSNSRASNLPMQKKELSSTHHKDHVNHVVSAIKSCVCLLPQRKLSGRISRSVRSNEINLDYQYVN